VMQDIFLLKLSGGAIYLKLSPETRRKKKVFKFSQPVVRGWYDKFDGHLIAVYRLGENLYVSVGDEEFLLSEVSTELHVKDEYAEFKLIVDNKIMFHKKYKRKAFVGLNKHDLNYVESNDDLLYSLHALVNNPNSWNQTFNYCEEDEL